jgi:hypothetical protein
MIDFPASPTVGQQFTAAGVTWIWDGAKWLPSGLSPTVAPGINDNRLINGDMRIDQRGVASGAGGTASGYTVDRWQYYATQTARITWSRGAGAGIPGFSNCLRLASSSAYTPLAADWFMVYQPIEADQIVDFQFGTANAQPVTLSFWAQSSLTGSFSGCVQNYASTRSYPFSFSLPTANTWTKIAITIPGDTAGTWVMSGSGGGMNVIFDLGSGATNRGAANAWASVNYSGVTGAQSIVATNGATLLLTGVKLEIGSVATPFNRYSLAKSLADCQRYFQFATFGLGGTAAAAGVTVTYVQSLLVSMRATPTITPSETNAANMSTRVITPETPSTIRPNGTAANAFLWTGSFTASAEL